MKITTGAVATLTIKMHDLGAWGEDCQMAQVYEQASRAAIDRLHKIILDSNHHARIEIVGEPEVTAILATRK